VSRKTVQKITPQTPSSFDQQFWPVIVALTVLCGIAVGAILTLLRGPWMWGSLLVLPAAAALALYLLFKVPDSKLRRSLQLAIITSLAVHLLILVLSSVVTIFGNPFQPPKKQIARRPDRTILVTDQRTQFVWQETNRRDTPEPEVQPEKQQVQETTTTAKPQPIPVEPVKTEVQPQLVRRETTAKTVPRLDQSLSKLSRQTQDHQPQSSQQATAQPAQSTAQSSAQAEAKVTPQPTESTAAEAVQRQSETTPTTATESQPQLAAATPSPTPAPTVTRPDSSPRRAAPDATPVESAPQPSQSTARKKNPTPELPIVQQTAPTNPPSAATAQQSKAKPEPSAAATSVTRRPTRSETTSPSLVNSPKSAASPTTQVTASAQRRQTQTPSPTIPSPSSQTSESRRSTTDAAIAASPVAIEKPSFQPDSSSATSQLNSKSLSVTRSTEGVAGTGRSQNLESAVGGMTSPATTPSATAKRRESTSPTSENQLLAASQSSTARRSVSEARTPSSAFMADTTAAAKISGSKTPTTQTAESSAARIDSASAAHRGEIAAEKGETSVDLGPTKIVADTTESRRLSGGGQPEVSQLNPESTRRSRSTDDQQPTLVADAGAESVAPRATSSAPNTVDMVPNAESTNVARSGGESPVTLERDAATETGESSNEGLANLSAQLADSRERAKSDSQPGAPFDDDDDEKDQQKGSARTEVALAPVISREPGIGSADSDLGESITAAERADISPGESTAVTLGRTATAVLPGSGIGRSATALLLHAATSLPVTDSGGPARSRGRSTSAELADSLVESLNSSPKLSQIEPGSRSTTAMPKLTEPTDPASPSNAVNTTSGAATNTGPAFSIAAAQVAIDRTESTDSQQGAAMEILAPEGAAGLGDVASISLGVMTLPASRDSLQIQPDFDDRFRKTEFGGTPAINPDAVLAKEAFQNRTPAAVAGAGEPETEAAIELGLEFLARHQSPDGSWSLSIYDTDHPQHRSQLNSDTAATGLALLAFQGAGYNHREFKYARTVNHAVQWLLEHQSEDGGLYVEADKKSDAACRLYSHGIATLALCEAYGMTQDARLKLAAQKALDYIVATQDARKGGWRYFVETNMRSSDTSVSGWMMMALQSGDLAGLDVDPRVFRGIDQWLDTASETGDESRYRYNPFAIDTEGVSRIQGRTATVSMTSVALLMRIYRGWDRGDSRLIDGAAYLAEEQMPSDATPRQRDTYYWYYATQVLKYLDGPLWEKWDAKLRPLLINSQVKTGDMAGSWHPYNPVPDRWGAFGGRLYVTTMNLLSLEVRYRMLPLYQKTK